MNKENTGISLQCWRKSLWAPGWLAPACHSVPCHWSESLHVEAKMNYSCCWLNCMGELCSVPKSQSLPGDLPAGPLSGSRDWICPRLGMLPPVCVWIETLFIYRCEISCVERKEQFKKQTTEQKSRSSFLLAVSIQAFFFFSNIFISFTHQPPKTNAAVSEPDTQTPCIL